MTGRFRVSVTRFVGSVLFPLAAMASCGRNPADPTPTALQITCPAPRSAESLTGNPVAVEFGAPTTTGGQSPVSVTCRPGSGSTFPVAATTVTCTATDAKQATSACNLTVTVTRPGALTATRFLAFGDSITFGSASAPCTVGLTAGMTFREFMARDARDVHPHANQPPPPSAYPNILQQLLRTRYLSSSSSAAVVTNAGEPNEGVTDGVGTNDMTVDRFRAELSRQNPQVLLLLEGVNDLVGFGHRPDQVTKVSKALGDLIRDARSRNVTVFLGTLLPNDPGGCRGRNTWDLIVPANNGIKALAGGGVVLVDLYEAFGGMPAPYIGFDGLHPTELGYEKVAQTFFTAIRQHLETPR